MLHVTTGEHVMAYAAFMPRAAAACITKQHAVTSNTPVNQCWALTGGIPGITALLNGTLGIWLASTQPNSACLLRDPPPKRAAQRPLTCDTSKSRPRPLNELTMALAVPLVSFLLDWWLSVTCRGTGSSSSSTGAGQLAHDTHVQLLPIYRRQLA